MCHRRNRQILNSYAIFEFGEIENTEWKQNPCFACDTCDTWLGGVGVDAVEKARAVNNAPVPKVVSPISTQMRHPQVRRSDFHSLNGDDDMPSQSDIRQQVTDQIISALKSNDLPPWKKCWANDPNGFGLATSLSTGKPYKGINQILLQVLAAKRGYQSRWFGTFNQIKHVEGSIRKGEKSMKVVLWKPVKRERSDENGEKVDDSFLVMREFSVFNVEQATDLDQFRVGFVQPQETAFERYEQADQLFDAIGADIRHGGNRAFYSPGGDFIQMPHRHQFDSAEAYYETLAHEAIHWSERRIGFDRSKEESAYALGELVAEIGSCFLMGELGLPTTDNLDSHAAYVGNWLKAMKGDTRFIFKAAATASKAVDFLLSHVRQPEEQPVPESLGTP